MLFIFVVTIVVKRPRCKDPNKALDSSFEGSVQHPM